MKKTRIIVWRLVLLIIILIGIIITIFNLLKAPIKKILSKDITGYVVAASYNVDLYNDEFKIADEIIRGENIKIKDEEIVDENNNKYYKVISNDNLLIKIENFSTKKEDIVKEKEMYVRTYTTVYKNNESSEILSSVDKGEKLIITGYDKILSDGSINKYQIKIDDETGYVYGKYLVFDKETSLKHYDEENTYLLHANCGDAYNVGTASNLDFYPNEKPKFKDNVMPDEVRALYLNAGVIRNVDEYIELAKKTKINAFVVDIKDNTSPGYESPVMKKYSETNYEKSINSFENYKKYIKKLKDEGFYVIGRITVFKDSFFVSDHPETALMDTETGKPLLHNGSYWPSAFNRLVWEFNVELAKEAVTEMGFNEIQFDYVRFPDGTYSYEASGKVNMRNTYDEEKAQAIQKFLMYATDEIHSVGAYVSADVFGESAHNYVTGYGQYWAAISNVVDAISAMPYPDHFSAHEYGFDEIVWTVPYKILNYWGEFVVKRQASIPTPAVVRTWVQAYDAVKSPRIKYDSEKISDQIKGLYDAGLTGGYMTWNAGSSLTKYEEIIDALKKEY